MFIRFKSKNISTAIFLVLISSAGCPSKADVRSWSSVQDRVPVIFGVGDSIGEGVQSADANLRTQPSSYLNLLAKQIGAHFPLPLIRSKPLGVIGNITLRSRLFPSIEGSNLAVSGTDVSSILNRRANASSEDEIDSERDLVLFPRLGSQIEIVEAFGPSLIICWIGSNDVLSAATSFDELDASQITPVEEFEADFKEIARRLVESGKTVVFANITDVTNIGFLLDSQDLIKFLGSDFGLAEGDFTSVIVMLLIRLGLDDGSLLKDPNFVLDAEEVQVIQQNVKVFNKIIEEVAASVSMPVVDINGFFNNIVANPPTFSAITITPRYLGGIMSLDGVHPSNIGHAFAANEFIKTINSHFNTNIPLISEGKLEKIFLNDPFVDKDNDGKVRGRHGAGLLETVGPFLGISGDKNDSIPDVPTQSDSDIGKQFIRRFLAIQGKDTKMVSTWDKEDSIEAFRYMFGLRIFNRSTKK